MFFYIDEFEPDSIEGLINQSVEVTRGNLNKTHLSDYYMMGADTKTRQFSRKQAGELLSDLDEAERQLRDYYPNTDESYQIVEGLVSTLPLSVPSRKQMYAQRARSQRVLDPFKGKASAMDRDMKSGKLLKGNLYSYSVNDEGGIVNERYHNINAQMYWAWLDQLDASGITTFFTVNYIETARFLAVYYKHIQKESHSTLNRYIKPRINVEAYDPQVLTLMGIEGVNLGEVKARELIERFGDVYSVVTASEEELKEVIGIGRKYAKDIYQSVRRD